MSAAKKSDELVSATEPVNQRRERRARGLQRAAGLLAPATVALLRIDASLAQELDAFRSRLLERAREFEAPEGPAT